jgi:uncharacterized protein (DUF1778 family)
MPPGVLVGKPLQLYGILPYTWGGEAYKEREMITKTTTTRTARLEARITPEQKALFERAAQLQGQTLTDYIVASLQRSSEEVIRAHHIITLSAQDSATFVEALLDPPEPNEYLQMAAARYGARRGQA